MTAKYMIVALTAAAIAGWAASPAFAESKPCDPPKPGYELDASGKCVPSPSVKPAG